MAEYRLSGRAALDVAEIADYTLEQFGIEQARQYRDAMESCFLRLAENPMLGRSAAEFGQDLRRYPRQSHIIFYLPTTQGVRIVRVLHENMNIGHHL